MRAIVIGLALALAGCAIPKGPGWDCFLVARAMQGSDQVNATPAPKDSATRCFAPPAPDAGQPLVEVRECSVEQDNGAYFSCTPDVATPAAWLRANKVTGKRPRRK